MEGCGGRGWRWAVEAGCGGSRRRCERAVESSSRGSGAWVARGWRVGGVWVARGWRVAAAFGGGAWRRRVGARGVVVAAGAALHMVEDCRERLRAGRAAAEALLAHEARHAVAAEVEVAVLHAETPHGHIRRARTRRVGARGRAQAQVMNELHAVGVRGPARSTRGEEGGGESSRTQGVRSRRSRRSGAHVAPPSCRSKCR